MDLHSPPHKSFIERCSQTRTRWRPNYFCDDETRHTLVIREIDKEIAGLSKIQRFKGGGAIGLFTKYLDFICVCFTMRLVLQIISRVVAWLSVMSEMDSIWKKSVSDLRPYHNKWLGGEKIWKWRLSWQRFKLENLRKKACRVIATSKPTLHNLT